jgi:hypothetical protein
MQRPQTPAPVSARRLPEWCLRIASRYESGAASQFLLTGNVLDGWPVPGSDRLGPLEEVLSSRLLAPFEVIFHYDLSTGLRVERGGETLAQWPSYKEKGPLPRHPFEALRFLDHYFRYLANIRVLGKRPPSVTLILRDAGLVFPVQHGPPGYDLSAAMLQVRAWSTDPHLADLPLAVFLVAENLADLHPLLAGNPRAEQIELPLPSAQEITSYLSDHYDRFASVIPKDLTCDSLGEALAGTSFAGLDSLLKSARHEKRVLDASEVAMRKRDLLERESQGLIDFVRSEKSLDDYLGHDALKARLRQDIRLWNAGDATALPMGYLLCGPVGTGKTFLIDCLAGEAGIPVARIRNFRDRWIGSTEANLERIFRMLHALGRAVVFVDEADQALGKRDSSGGDAGVSSRVYAMFAEEMSRPANRGKLLWVLATSRPDLVEVDLKRPGRVDLKIPIFPCADAHEAWSLIRGIGRRKGLDLPGDPAPSILDKMPAHLTPGAADALVLKVYRTTRTEKIPAINALDAALDEYRPAVSGSVMRFQIGLAASEASDLSLIPPAFREYLDPSGT